MLHGADRKPLLSQNLKSKKGALTQSKSLRMTSIFALGLYWMMLYPYVNIHPFKSYWSENESVAPGRCRRRRRSTDSYVSTMLRRWHKRYIFSTIRHYHMTFVHGVQGRDFYFFLFAVVFFFSILPLHYFARTLSFTPVCTYVRPFVCMYVISTASAF